MNNTNTVHKEMRKNPTAPGQRYLTWLGPLRMLILTIISFGYASTMPRGPQEKEYLNMLGYDPSWLGISIIFMISGYLAMRSLNCHGSSLRFLRSRMVRILPMLVLFASLVIFVVFPLFGVPLAEGESRVSQHILYFFKVVSTLDPSELTPGLLDNALYMCIIHGGLWTFRWGLVAYIATALLWLMGGLQNTKILLSLTLLTIIGHIGILYYAIEINALASLEDHSTLDLLVTGLRLGWAYMVGMCAYTLRNKIPYSLFIPLALISFAVINYYFLRWTPWIEISLDMGLGYLAFIAMRSTREVPPLIKSMPDLSLGIYIFNWPTAQLVLLMVPSLNALSLFALSFPIALFLAYVSWALLIRPINFEFSTKAKRPMV